MTNKPGALTEIVLFAVNSPHERIQGYPLRIQ